MSAPWGGAGSLDEKMIADLREWRSRITPAPSEAERSAGHLYSVQIRLEELDALLAAVADRDVLKREACEMPDEKAGYSVRLTPVMAIVNGRRLRDVATEIDAAVEADERILAWNEIAAHPFFRECYGTETSLLDAMLAKLTASTFEAPIPAEVRERAAVLPAGHAIIGGVVVPLPTEPAMRTPGFCSHCGGSIYYSVPIHAWVHSGAVPKCCVPRPTPRPDRAS